MPSTASSQPLNGTAAFASTLFVLAGISAMPAPSVSEPKLIPEFRRGERTGTARQFSLFYGIGETVPSLSDSTTNNSSNYGDVAPQRTTTELEKLIGALRSWTVFNFNWDGEGAETPMKESLEAAEEFARLWPSDKLPEPMLHPSGHAGLFWNDNQLYADLEFVPGKGIAYYVERGQNKHKGVSAFDIKFAKAIPIVLQAALLGVEPV
jgi:hypothetical protein